MLTLRRGRHAEAQALDHLQRHGLKLIARNFRCRQGELDLVMQDGRTVVFVEVRCRNNPRYGSGAESVNARKRARLTAAALYFLQTHPRWQQAPARFDVVSIREHGGATRIDWIRNAFET